MFSYFFVWHFGEWSDLHLLEVFFHAWLYCFTLCVKGTWKTCGTLLWNRGLWKRSRGELMGLDDHYAHPVPCSKPCECMLTHIWSIYTCMLTDFYLDNYCQSLFTLWWTKIFPKYQVLILNAFFTVSSWSPQQTVQVGVLFHLCFCLRLPFPMHHTSKCLTDTGQSFVSPSEVELSSSSEEVEALSLSHCQVLEFGVSPSFSLTLWPTRRLPGLLISHSSQRGQRASASWEKGASERESCHGR